MRYADGPEVAGEIQIDASPATVWALVTDIGLSARFSPELQRVAWLDGADAPVIGARFEGHNRNEHNGDWRTVSEVVELEPERSYAWAVIDAAERFGPLDPQRPMATWRFDLTPVDGGTRLRHSGRIGPGRSGLLVAIEQAPEREEAIMEYRTGTLRQGIEATLEGVRKLAEGE
ncbi:MULTISPECIES: SRPBCC family protein [Streptomyces]|uniref:SRPBCC family protein n=1 Tax=Streptomyces TaxID=1883 RepID=UPI00224902BE|nr:SRPBCC family protein [Streptomyces sp. JHD 1]MCX2969299.1 SRPBCC family protein [Streptomyces sp. JHD 1]